METKDLQALIQVNAKELDDLRTNYSLSVSMMKDTINISDGIIA